MVPAGPHTVGARVGDRENSQDEMEGQRGRRETGTDGDRRGRRGQCAGGGHGGSGAGAVWPLARRVDVQLALENVVNDGLGQVIHDVAVPMLQGQPALG